MEVADTGSILPADAERALLAGRLDLGAGPTPVLLRKGAVEDMSRHAPTVADLAERTDLDAIRGDRLFGVEELIAHLAAPRSESPVLLSPIDIQVVKAAGVTFARSAIERVIEERARGDASAAADIRGRIEGRIGGEIRAVVPGSPEAARLKAALIEDGLWSQYLEVAIGPDAEIFTKAPVLSTVGWGAEIGVRSDSDWNNPEPEVVLIVDSAGRPAGATLGNDVNLRDFEGRSALLLGKAKDNNASCALGPFIRLFDDEFTLDDVRAAEVQLEIRGTDGYLLRGVSSMREISRSPEELVRQAMSEHDYPDGFVLFLGTLFAPVQDRDEPGRGFTHKRGDVVRISSPKLGSLVNRVTTSKAAPPWRLGIRGLIANLAGRGLIGGGDRGQDHAA
ncbi:fumarylacetoacetate hydrolase family protein [Sphingosinicella sp. LHD-64]|uniref:fumarylacetoacetate hydrolase family protein n=1 Tax=Sphingosinicella sp. LHD-64 TaxID=3072139 RepID=UPI00280F440B|nr:fumarylacetoacetate hydrolase family protein [Sphingosinicella sp. LHD-64]MDQ8757148.1 fumarylacetoacetate hydrolase family protein [Sphingosinicella sp. LHD-64]